MPDPALLQQSSIDAAAVLAWYDRNARLLPWRVSPADRAKGVRPDPYRVWLSEIMLQQTTIGAVGRYYERFLSFWPTVADLAAARLEEVLVEWAGLGYYARARNLHACATAVMQDHGGQFPQTMAGLQTLPGVGAYTAAAIAAICFDEPVAVLDGNVERLIARYLALPTPVQFAKGLIRQEVAEAVPARSGDFAQALMDLGATVCAPRAVHCLVCPLEPRCQGTRTADPLEFPVKLAKQPRPTRFGHAFVMTDMAGEIYLRTRPATGLLARMTEVPGSPWVEDRTDPPFPVRAADWRFRGEVTHVFTHFRLELDVWSANVRRDAAPLGGWWAHPRDFDQEALPSLYRKVLASALAGRI